ncbi:MAG: tetratricopeptide repeat protein [Deltaproteobacteria bacterium]|nr:tetratricopeptide repeat protein [Deltaproteobacteria bacterium]
MSDKINEETANETTAANVDDGGVGTSPNQSSTNKTDLSDTKNDALNSNANNATMDIPAHLQLPSFDFSLPQLDNTGERSSVASSESSSFTFNSDSADIPAHLQLPTFPAFDMPPIPGEAPADSKKTTEIKTSVTDQESTGTQPAINTSDTPTPPPLRPPPRPRRQKPIQNSHPAKNSVLPSLVLPNLNVVEPAKKEVTLLGSEAAHALAEVKPHKRPVLPFVIIAALIIVGVGAWIKRDAIVLALAAKERRPQVVETTKDKALAFFAAGQHAYEKNDLSLAVEKFKSAIAILPNFSKAHRALAIAYAKQNKAADAVRHYRKYLDLNPNAPEAAAVRKIIADYQKAKEAVDNKAPKDNRKNKRKLR